MTPFDYIIHYWDLLDPTWRLVIEWFIVITLGLKILSPITMIVLALFGVETGKVSLSYFKEWSDKLIASIGEDYREHRTYAYEQADEVRDDLELRISELENRLDEELANIEPDGLTKEERRDRDFELEWARTGVNCENEQRKKRADETGEVFPASHIGGGQREHCWQTIQGSASCRD